MEVKYSDTALKDIKYWKKTNNIIIQKRIQELIKAIELSPYTGTGNPEALKHELAGYWSCRINKEHRIIYKVENNIIFIDTLRHHYK
jgi:toxin YoeB